LKKELELTEEAKQKNLLQKGEGILIHAGTGVSQKHFEDFFLYRPGQGNVWLGNDRAKALGILEGWRSKP